MSTAYLDHNNTATGETIMNTKAHLITHNGESRGKLYYTTLTTHEMKVKQGNFQLDADGVTIIARNLSGRNRFKFITVDQIIDFIPAGVKS
jgi:hypothetical protein